MKRREITFKQEQAIIEMMKPGNKTYTDIARSVGINPRTLYNWRKKPEFIEARKEAFKDIKRSVESFAESRIQIQAYGDLKYYKAEALNERLVIQLINNIFDEQINLAKRLEGLGSEFESANKIIEKISNKYKH